MLILCRGFRIIVKAPVILCWRLRSGSSPTAKLWLPWHGPFAVLLFWFYGLYGCLGLGFRGLLILLQTCRLAATKGPCSLQAPACASDCISWPLNPAQQRRWQSRSTSLGTQPRSLGTAAPSMGFSTPATFIRFAAMSAASDMRRFSGAWSARKDVNTESG